MEPLPKIEDVEVALASESSEGPAYEIDVVPPVGNAGEQNADLLHPEQVAVGAVYHQEAAPDRRDFTERAEAGGRWGNTLVGDLRNFRRAVAAPEVEIAQLNTKECILTTEKDFMRLKDNITVPLYYLPIETAFVENEEQFLNRINRFITEFKE